MTPSDNPFLIRSQTGAGVIHETPNTWVIDVSRDGLFAADFLQTDANLDITVVLSDVGAKCQLNCFYLCNDNNKIDIKVKVLHKSPETTSSQQVRGLATDSGFVSFNGTITIPHVSQKCDGHQNHRGIVLSHKAQITASPQLEIWADDVKCAHGSAIGPLPADQIFYLQTRGLPEAEAKKLLLSSFFGDLIPPTFETTVREWMDRHV